LGDQVYGKSDKDKKGKPSKMKSDSPRKHGLDPSWEKRKNILPTKMGIQTNFKPVMERKCIWILGFFWEIFHWKANNIFVSQRSRLKVWIESPCSISNPQWILEILNKCNGFALDPTLFF